ncbi:efflux RND transporter periplasmic adaptor subunit [Fimbriiglobus ruber]|uniref:Putative Co/Zn/Cd efflux system membrane fusion protein n=1 Tax=Fimbriiglobus ruber TaxID=1908690 RepID=A0A225DL46_9BACT|nr:efflux RND transporter periplasmic adaptor subunit [Fimbriiglobus ruber]OWK41683.1 putative Co/Zn/Cd efflux system membrane fusion protein [Fimbriiglobus ruber]
MQPKQSGTKRTRWLVGLVVLAVVAAGAWHVLGRGKPALGSVPTNATAGSGTSVEVVSPRAGGIDRVCVQPGTVEPFESADLYAKVSGFLVDQKVDIGSLVKEGDVLARISVPEYEKQMIQDAADVTRTEARVDQMTAAVTTADADLGAATAAVALAGAELKSKTSHRTYREKQRERIRELASRMAIDAKLADEQEDQFQSAVSAELAAMEAVNASKQKEVAARARIKQAQADLRYAAAEVAVAKARKEKSQVLLDYTVIRSPYTGVITKRNFYKGDFIRAADSGGERVPVLAVERTDVMRVVIQVPERDVPFADPGDPAVVTVDALPGVVFKTTGADNKVEISRLAASEDPHTRMMRVEVDVKNPTGKLRRGMYGRVNLTLCPGAASAVCVPSAALVGKAEDGKASVRVVRDDVVHIVPVRYGADNGTEMEIVSGLTPADRVIIRASGPVENGTQVTTTHAGKTKS